MSESQTHFGYEKIASNEKTARVGEVFHSVAKRYDLMNDLMSFGLHRIWKRIAVAKCGDLRDKTVLDLAGGTGDLAFLLSEKVGPNGNVILGDINASMLSVGRKRLIDKGIVNSTQFVQTNAESLPFQDDSIDCITFGFGLRNVTHQTKALREITRVLKQNGRVVILEFSAPVHPGLSKIYDVYSFSVLPFLGKIVTQDSKSYQYLAESIRMHPNQESLKQMMGDAGLKQVAYDNLMNGIVAIHVGFKRDMKLAEITSKENNDRENNQHD